MWMRRVNKTNIKNPQAKIKCEYWTVVKQKPMGSGPITVYKWEGLGANGSRPNHPLGSKFSQQDGAEVASCSISAQANQ